MKQIFLICVLVRAPCVTISAESPNAGTAKGRHTVVDEFGYLGLLARFVARSSD